MQRRSVFMALCLSAGAGNLACKRQPESSSSVAALGELLGEKQVNSCRGTHSVIVSNDQLRLENDAQVQAAQAALSAVPEDLQRAVFLAPQLRTRVVLASVSLESHCPAAKALPGRDLKSCFAPSADGQGLSIYIQREESDAKTIANIHHSLVRSVGAILSEVIFDRQSQTDSQIHAEYLQNRATLSAAFLADSAQKVNLLDSTLSLLLGQEILATGISVETRQQRLLANASQAQVDAFMHAVAADAFDSNFCSTGSPGSTLAVFQRDFPGTYSVYQSLFASEFGAAMASSTTSLNLWGRWGPGNGPIRQGLSNWGQYRASGGGLFNVRRWNNGGGFVFQRPWFAPWRWGQQ